MSGAVGSSPSLTRSGLPSRAAVASLASRPPSGRHSTAFLARNAASEAVSAIRSNGILATSRPGMLPPFRRSFSPSAGLSLMSVAEPPSVTHLPLPDPGEPPKRRRPKIKKLRLLLLILGLSALALVSTVFGMMMAVASDLGDLATDANYRDAKNSVLLDIRGRQIGVLVNNQNLVFVPYEDISPAMRHAIIAIEDRRFYTNNGIDLRGIGRAFFNDIFGGGGTQGGSTITQQFVKNATNQQNNRTIFEKLREAALAYHLTRKWSKEKILTQYLNTIYFGNGAYGIESAARIYFGADHPGCGTHGEPACAALLKPGEAALLAGMVANPSGYDPQTRWRYAMSRRNLVLKNMLDQHYITQSDYDAGV